MSIPESCICKFNMFRQEKSLFYEGEDYVTELSSYFNLPLELSRISFLSSHRGMFECFLGGLDSRLVTNISKALMSFGLVWEGSITSSM